MSDDNIEPDLLAEHLAADPRKLTGEQRDRLAEELGKDRAYVDALIAKMSKGWTNMDPHVVGFDDGGWPDADGNIT